MVAPPKLRALAPVPRIVEPLLPSDDYLLGLTKSDVINTSKGQAIQCTMEVLAGEHARHTVIVTMYVEHPTQSTADHAIREFHELCKAVGLNGPPDDMNQLYDIPLMGYVYIRPEQGDHPATNSVRKFRSAA